MKIILAIVIGITLMSCSNKILMTKTAITKYQLSENDLTSIQYYATYDIVLNRYEAATEEKSTEKGALNLNLGQEVEQVIIKRGTKGKCVRVFENGKLGISFEPDDNKYLVFGSNLNSDALFLQALDWNSGRGKLQYGDQTFITSPGADKCSISFKLNKYFKEDREVRTAKGNKVR